MDGIQRQNNNSGNAGPSGRPTKRSRPTVMNNSASSSTRTNLDRLTISNLTNLQPSASGSSNQSAGSGPNLPTRSNNPIANNPIAIDDDTPLAPVQARTPAPATPGRRTVIDLTADSPPREIIDVDALPDTPDVEFQYARPAIPRAPHIMPHRHTNYPHQAGYMGNLGNPFYNNRQLPAPNQNVGLNAGGFLHQLVQVMHGNRAFGAASMVMGGGGDAFLYRAQSIEYRAPGPVGFRPPGVLDYRHGARGILDDEMPEERPPSYKAPAKAKEGFTRSPTSDTTVICPKCSHELGENNGDKLQATVWVGKCGHVYCGKCATEMKNSSSKRKARGAASKAVNTCVVDDCATKFSNKGNIWEVFL